MGSKHGRHSPAASAMGMMKCRTGSGVDQSVGQRACRAACPPDEARRGATCLWWRGWRAVRYVRQVWIRFGQGGWTASFAGWQMGVRDRWAMARPMERAARGEKLEARKTPHLSPATVGAGAPRRWDDDQREMDVARASSTLMEGSRAASGTVFSSGEGKPAAWPSRPSGWSGDLFVGPWTTSSANT